MKSIEVSEINFNFLELQQPSGTMYMGILKAFEIEAISKVNRLSDEFQEEGIHHEKNVQRDENIRRVKAISKYAETPDAIFPTPIILSGSSDTISIDFEKKIINFKESASKNFSIIDGQHRLSGIKESKIFENLNLPIVICLDTEPYQDAMIFITINGNQVKVPMSIIYQLFEIMPGRSVEKTSHTIVKTLNADEASPFYNRIKMLGTKAKSQDFAPLTQSSFITPLLSCFKKNGIFYEYYQQEKDPVIYKILLNYFSSVADAFHEDWNSNDSLLPKAIGHKALVELLQNNLFEIGRREGTLDKNFFDKKMIKIAAGFDSKITSKKYGSSYGGAGNLYKDFVMYLEKE
ncbi:DGQHR domain-containing protein [Carnobacterium sp.]|uniref:DGQHR domain-containing protein n=1 Tax=Carnobacterium sp. TaxID=48221 RepID=UPI003890605A